MRMENRTAILSILFAFLLGGCAPNAVTYYRPNVDGGEILKPRCVPTESIVEFSLPDSNGRLRVRAWADNGKSVNQVSLFFSGTAWSRIHFTSNKFQIRDVENNSTAGAASVLAYKSDGVSDLAAVPYLAPPERPGLFRFHVQINLPDPMPDIFELVSPSIVIDGEEMEFPIMRFEQKLWMGVSPFNC